MHYVDLVSLLRYLCNATECSPIKRWPSYRIVWPDSDITWNKLYESRLFYFFLNLKVSKQLAIQLVRAVRYLLLDVLPETWL